MRLTIREIADLKEGRKTLSEIQYYKKSYSHKPHLGSLPHDRRTNDPDKLQERIDVIDERLKKIDKEIKKTEKELDNLIKDKKGEIEQNIKDAEKQIRNAKSTIRRWENYYIRSFGQDFDKFYDYYEAMDDLETDAYPPLDGNREDNDSHGMAMGNYLNGIAHSLVEVDNVHVWEMKDPKKSATFEESLKNLKDAKETFNEYMDLCDKYDVNIEERGWLRRDMFDDAIEYLEYMNEAQQKIDKNTKYIEKQETLLNNLDNSSSKDTKKINNLQNKLEKLQREKQDYLDERDRTETKKDEVKE